MLKSLLLASVLALPLIASADTPKPDTTKTDTTKTDKPAAAKLTADEVAIVAHLHHVNVMEIDMGKTAKANGTAAVKRYGETLITDHTQADKDLTAMAKKKGLAKIPADMPKTDAEKAEAKDMMATMMATKKLKGADFDKAYLQMMVDGHEKELAKSDVFLSSATDSDLKTVIEGRKTTLTRHADAAKELQKGSAQASVIPDPSAPKPMK